MENTENTLYAVKAYDSDMEGGDYQGQRHRYVAVFPTKGEAEAFVLRFVSERAAGIAHNYDGELLVCKPEIWLRHGDYWTLESQDYQRSIDIEEFSPYVPKRNNIGIVDMNVVEEIG